MHTYRENIKGANCLANWAGLSKNCWRRDKTPHQLRGILRLDKEGLPKGGCQMHHKN